MGIPIKWMVYSGKSPKWMVFLVENPVKIWMRTGGILNGI
jgi:hypothetical protein